MFMLQGIWTSKDILIHARYFNLEHKISIAEFDPIRMYFNDFDL